MFEKSIQPGPIGQLLCAIAIVLFGTVGCTQSEAQKDDPKPVVQDLDIQQPDSTDKE